MAHIATRNANSYYKVILLTMSYMTSARVPTPTTFYIVYM